MTTTPRFQRAGEAFVSSDELYTLEHHAAVRIADQVAREMATKTAEKRGATGLAVAGSFFNFPYPGALHHAEHAEHAKRWFYTE
jgi:hypothetical protein